MLQFLQERERSAVLRIASIVRNLGGRAWLVGGAVRDALLSSPVKDADLEIFNLPSHTLHSALAKEFSLDLVGASFGVFKLHHFAIDVALPRRESKSGSGHRAFTIEGDPSLSLPSAASRRDFTINAIYLDPLTGELADPFSGRRDLLSRTLRHVSPKFSEDPLRVLRGMQLSARFLLSPAPETISICRTMTPENLPPERLFSEWTKLLLKGIQISRGLSFLRSTSWLRFFPELHRLVSCPQDPQWHPEGDVWNHTCLCLDRFAATRTGNDPEDLIVGLAVLCHDFGKPLCTIFKDGHYRSPGHDALGRAPTLSFLSRLTNEERILRSVPTLVAAHMQPFQMFHSHATDSAVRRLALKVGRIDRLLRVCRADSEGRAGSWPPPNELSWLAARAEALRIAAAAPKPIIMGRHLIALGLKPAPQFSTILSQCFSAQLDGAFSTLPSALSYLHALLHPQ